MTEAFPGHLLLLRNKKSIMRLVLMYRYPLRESNLYIYIYIYILK